MAKKKPKTAKAAPKKDAVPDLVHKAVIALCEKHGIKNMTAIFLTEKSNPDPQGDGSVKHQYIVRVGHFIENLMSVATAYGKMQTVLNDNLNLYVSRGRAAKDTY